MPLESGYFEAYNEPHVHLVDIKKYPIDNVTGIRTQNGKEYELYVVLYATGFNAITGAWVNVDWRCRDGIPLMGNSGTKAGEQAKWVDYLPHTYLNFMMSKTPNMFMVFDPR